MNKHKWREVEKLQLSDYMTKLTEEVGEVARELSDMKQQAEGGHKGLKKKLKNLRQLQNELLDVCFIAECLTLRASMEIAGVERAIMYGK